jgi:CDP-diacylglycerol pyrophosphatase
MQTSNAYALNDRIIKREFTINEIRFGYAKIARQDNPNQYLLVPAWDFFGTCKDTMAANISDPNYDKDNASIENNFRQSFMTINAIDGSAINRNLGY